METQRFKTGTIYETRLLTDWDIVLRYEIVKRTEKSVWIKDLKSKNARVKRCGVKVFSGVETIYPEGRYSLCPILDAGKVSKNPGI